MNLFKLANANNYHTYNRELAKKIGLETAIFLSELLDKYCYLEERGQLIEIDGIKEYFYMTIDDVEERTALTRSQQDTAIANCKALGIVELKLKGMPAKRHFRISKEMIINLLNPANQFAEIANKFAKPDKPVCSVLQTGRGEHLIYKNPSKDPNLPPLPPPSSLESDCQKEKWRRRMKKKFGEGMKEGVFESAWRELETIPLQEIKSLNGLLSAIIEKWMIGKEAPSSNSKESRDERIERHRQEAIRNASESIKPADTCVWMVSGKQSVPVAYDQPDEDWKKSTGFC